MNTTLPRIARALSTLVLMLFGVCGNDTLAAPVDTPSVVWSTPLQSSARMSAMSKDGRRVLYSDAKGSLGNVVVIDVMTGNVTAQFDVNFDTNHQGRDNIKSMHFLNDTSFMVVTSWSFYVMDSRTGKLIDDVGLPSTGAGIDCAIPMHNTDRWIVGATNRLFSYDYKTKRLDTIYFSPANGGYGHSGSIVWVGLSHDESVVYSAGKHEANGPGRLCAWELATGKQIYQVVEPDSTRFNVVSKQTHGNFYAAANSLGSASTGFAEVYDLRTGILVSRYRDVAIETQGVGVSRDGAVVGIQGDGRIDFYTTKEPHLFASMRAWPAFDIRFLDDGTSDVLLGQVDSLVQRVRLNLSTSVNGDASSQALQCSIFPNPSSGQATLQIQLANPTVVSVRLSTTDGRVVSERTLGLVQAGSYTEVLQAPSGYYMCTITTGPRTQTLPVVFR